MRGLLIVMVLTVSASADVGFGWTAPASCPSVSSIEARVEQRLGRALDPELAIAVAVTLRDGHYVANLTLGTDVRSLTSDRCDELSDAIAIIVARVADERRVTPPIRIAVIEAAASTVEPLVVHRDLDQPVERHPWSLGVRLSGVSGIGIVPEVGLGAEVAVSARHDKLLAEIGATKWLASGADHTNSHVDVGLGVMALRLGWKPRPALRGWLSAEVGAMDGTGTDAPTSQRWVAAGAGFGVEWPLLPWLRVVGATEILLAIERVKFEQANGGVIYAPSPMSARATLGIEVGWQ